MNDERYRSVKVVLFLALAWCLVAVAPARGSAPDYRKLEYPKLHDIVVPEVQRITLPNGLRLFVLEDHELPLVRVSARIRVGSMYEPADKIGLAAMTGEVMRTGGTESRTGDEIDEALERIAASVETGIGLSYGTASMSALTQDIDTALAILADVLMHPAFREDKIFLAKMQERTAISRRNDTPGQIAGREFNKLIYGADSVYARHSEYATIDAITRGDLIGFHREYFGPNNMIVAAWGDFETDDMIARIEKAFDGWEQVDADLPGAPEVEYGYPNTVNLVRKADINQSNIYLGHIGGLKSDADYFALTVMNRILGGGMTGRLFKNVRSRQGLAYSVFGVYGTGFSYPGTFYVGCQTKSENTVRAIRAMIDEIHKMQQAEVTDEELAIAKESFLNSFVFNFDTKGEIIGRLMAYEYYGYPPDFLQRMKERVEEVTKADVLRVAKEHLCPDDVQVLVVGRPDDFDESLSVLGDVGEIDVTIPSPGK